MMMMISDKDNVNVDDDDNGDDDILTISYILFALMKIWAYRSNFLRNKQTWCFPKTKQ